jgi:hypothetical protein
MGDIAVRRPATLFVVLLAAILLLLAATSVGRATLAAISGHSGPVPAVINAGTSNHLNVAVQSAPIESDAAPKGGKHGKGNGGDGGD